MKFLNTLLTRYHFLISIIIILLSVLLRIAYLNYTSYNQRSYDADDHLAYIEFVANNLRLPAPDKGWEYHQAPLYYTTTAIIYKLSHDKLKSLEVLSLVYSTVSLIFGVLLLRLLFNKNTLFLSASLLFLTWPTGIIHSIRIGNDPMYYMMSIISLYFLIKWLAFQNMKHFYITTIFTALTLAVKLNGIVLLAIVIAALLYQYYKDKKPSIYIKPIIFLITVILLSLTLSFSRNLKAASSLKNFNLINGNTPTSMNKGLAIKNNFSNYVTFDENLFITQTFTSPWEDKGGRQYFWNYLLKTMLFGEFNYTTPFNTIFSTIINAIITEIIIFFGIGLIRILYTLTREKSVLLLYLLFSLASLIYYRHSFPFSSNGDFRFIFPTIIPCIYIYFSGIEYFTKHKLKLIGILGYVLTYIMVICSCAFFLSPIFYGIL